MTTPPDPVLRGVTPDAAPPEAVQVARVEGVPVARSEGVPVARAEGTPVVPGENTSAGSAERASTARPASDAADGPAPAGTGIDPAERTPRSFHVSRQVLERARAAAYWLSRRGDGAPTTISELVEAALRQEVERLENKHNDGAPFPAVRGRLRTGPGAAGAERIRQAQRARHRPTDG